MKAQLKEEYEYMKLDINDFDEVYELREAMDTILHQIIEGHIDVYYYDLRKWAVDNYDFVDEAIEQGLTAENPDFHQLIQSGQFVCYEAEANKALEELFNELKEEAYEMLV